MSGVDGQGRLGDTVGVTAGPVGDGDGHDGLRYAIAHAFEEDQSVPLMHGMAVARRLLEGPIAAWAEQRARERAAKELRDAYWATAAIPNPDAVRDVVLTRAFALAADDRTGQRC